jgi:hypothetical protein
MPILTFDSAAALEHFEASRHSRWYRNGADTNDATGDLAVQRMKNPLFTPGVTNTFTISRRDRFFAIGSCFARGIEGAMKGRGLDVVSAANDFDAFELANPQVTGLGFTNKYNTHAILNELRWALDPKADFPFESIYEIDDERSVDPHTNPTLKLVSFDRTVERRRTITDVNTRIAGCRVVVITLGLVEAWRDEKADVFLNATPRPEMLAREPDRYTLHVLDAADNLANLEATQRLLQAHGHSDVHIVVTVSPVPLMATFTGRDVVTANTYSKSTLRSAAEEWAAAHSNIDYFPSYEIVMNSDRGLAWADDGRHVQGDVVRHIMGVFADAYLEDA